MWGPMTKVKWKDLALLLPEAPLPPEPPPPPEAPKPPEPPNTDPKPEEPPRSSLAPTQFEELFGEGAEALLLDVLDRPDAFSRDQQDLARVLLGRGSVRPADDTEREHIDAIARQLASLKPPAPQAPTEEPRPAYVRTREEMEDL